VRKTAVLNVVGLTPDLLGENTPNINKIIERGGMLPLDTITPAVTAPVQSTLVTGLPPDGHGVVANGWYFRELAEVWFWRQSNHLVRGEKVWDAARRIDPDFSCAKLFWWYNMYSSADYSITPRPMYPADGRKLPDVYTHPAGLRDELNSKLGQFPLFNFWGPTADIVSTEWVADSAIEVYEQYDPVLSLVYLPHLDYNLQRLGPSNPEVGKDVLAVDEVCGKLIERFDRDGANIVVLSEYGITDVSGAVNINRVLRKAGWLKVRQELGREILDAGASEAFAVVDHQIAHIYVSRDELIPEIKRTLEELPGVESVLDDEGKRSAGLAHPRSGELVAISRADRWFSYYFWLDDERAPDYARTVDIHRKPGYDPVELFLDPSLLLPKVQIAWKLAKKVAGFRTLMDFIPLDTTLVRGSHGRPTDRSEAGPLFVSSDPSVLSDRTRVAATDVKSILLDLVFGRSGAGNESLKQAG
jgi:predicted AlkP superfamily pyrophosphatase or phosphodiesterase